VAGEIALGLANVLFPALEREGLLPLPLLCDEDQGEREQSERESALARQRLPVCVRASLDCSGLT
jgi:hypothetical protein